MLDLEQLKYPIGKLQFQVNLSKEDIALKINELAQFPEALASATINLNEEQLDTPYRPGGWTVRQVVHHCADSHSQALTRIKLALTQDNPSVYPYNQDAFSALPDSKEMYIEASLSILEGLHDRMVRLLSSLDDSQWKRTYYHEGSKKQFTIEATLQLYVWHCHHHLKHISNLVDRNFSND